MDLYKTDMLPNTKILLLGRLSDEIECTAVLIIESNIGSISYGFILNSTLANGMFYASGEKIDYHNVVKCVNHALFQYIDNKFQGAMFDFKSVSEKFLDDIVMYLDNALRKKYLKVYKKFDIKLPKSSQYFDIIKDFKSLSI